LLVIMLVRLSGVVLTVIKNIIIIINIVIINDKTANKVKQKAKSTKENSEI